MDNLDKINWSPQDILPAGMNVLLANAECRNPLPAVSTISPHNKKNPPRHLSPGGFILFKGLPDATCRWYKTLTAIDRLFTRRLERNSRIFSASSANSWEHLAFLTGIATAALVSGLCFFSCTALRATSRFVSEPFFSIELLFRC